MLANRCFRAQSYILRVVPQNYGGFPQFSVLSPTLNRRTHAPRRMQSTLKNYDMADAPKPFMVPPVAIPRRSSSLAQLALEDYKLDSPSLQYFNEAMYTLTDAVARSRTSKEYMRQIRSEQEQQQQAIDRYRDEITELLRIGKGTSFKSVHQFLVGWYEPFLREIQTECDLVRNKVPGNDRREYGPCLLLLPPDKLAVITMHTILNQILISGNNGASLTTTLLAIGESVQAEVNALKLQNNGEQLANTLQGLAAIRMVNRRARKLLATEEWPSWLMVKLGAALTKMLLSTAKMESGKPAFNHVISCRNDKKYGLLKCDETLFEMISQRDYELLLPAYQPMYTEPMPWTEVNKGGYLLLRSTLMRTRRRAQTTALRSADLSKIFEGLNALGRLPWRINTRVLDVVNEVWDNGGGLGELPSRTDLPLPSPDDFLDENGKLHKVRYNEMVKRTRMRNADLHSLRCDMKLKLQVGETYRDSVMYFPFNLDFRGRTYPIPPHLNHLGSDVCRGMLQFARAKPLGPRGLFWLKVHLANLCGVNKISLEERALWVDEHMDKVRDSAEKPLAGERWWLAADEPWQALATCFEITNAVDSGDPESYMTHMPVHQDGSCNGLQHYAALGRDSQGGKAVNLLPSDAPQDVYKGVCDIVVAKIEAEVNRPLPEDASDMQRREHACATWLHGKVDRKVVKQTVMTSVYGVTFIGAREQIYARLKEKASTDPSQVLTPEMENEIRACSMYLTNMTLGAIRELFQNARQIMDWLATVARLIASTGHPVSWVTPLGLPVAQPYRKSERHLVKTLMQSIILTTDEDALPIAPKQQRSAFPPNFVHSLDSTHMLMTAIEMERLGLDFTAVHDSYWTHPSEVDTMNDVLRDQFIELYSQPILEQLRNSIIARHPELEIPEIPERGDLDLDQIKRSTYFFA